MFVLHNAQDAAGVEVFSFDSGPAVVNARDLQKIANHPFKTEEGVASARDQPRPFCVRHIHVHRAE
ncbi:hypothetical protein GW813_02200 [bacterium]|nr:hypothetical protein [bacterium]